MRRFLISSWVALWFGLSEYTAVFRPCRCVDLLLKCGATVDARDKVGVSALIAAVSVALVLV